jgi:hypothetical protein
MAGGCGFLGLIRAQGGLGILGAGMGSAPFLFFYYINSYRGTPTTFLDLFCLAIHRVSGKNDERGLDKIFYGELLV